MWQRSAAAGRLATKPKMRDHTLMLLLVELDEVSDVFNALQTMFVESKRNAKQSFSKKIIQLDALFHEIHSRLLISALVNAEQVALPPRSPVLACVRPHRVCIKSSKTWESTEVALNDTLGSCKVSTVAL